MPYDLEWSYELMYESYGLIIVETWYDICSIDGIETNLIILLLWWFGMLYVSLMVLRLIL